MTIIMKPVDKAELSPKYYLNTYMQYLCLSIYVSETKDMSHNKNILQIIFFTYTKILFSSKI